MGARHGCGPWAWPFPAALRLPPLNRISAVHNCICQASWPVRVQGVSASHLTQKPTPLCTHFHMGSTFWGDSNLSPLTCTTRAFPIHLSPQPLLKFLNIYLFCGAGRLGTPGHTCGGQRETCRSPFSPPTLWVPGSGFQLTGLATSTLTLLSCLAHPLVLF